MKLEHIDTSTTAGKAEVMRLAAEGRRVVFRQHPFDQWKIPPGITWDWSSYDYSIIAEPVGPEEVWHVVHADGSTSSWNCQSEAERWAKKHGIQAVRYIRADLAGEKG